MAGLKYSGFCKTKKQMDIIKDHIDSVWQQQRRAGSFSFFLHLFSFCSQVPVLLFLILISFLFIFFWGGDRSSHFQECTWSSANFGGATAV